MRLPHSASPADSDTKIDNPPTPEKSKKSLISSLQNSKAAQVCFIIVGLSTQLTCDRPQYMPKEGKPLPVASASNASETKTLMPDGALLLPFQTEGGKSVGILRGEETLILCVGSEQYPLIYCEIEGKHYFIDYPILPMKPAYEYLSAIDMTDDNTLRLQAQSGGMELGAIELSNVAQKSIANQIEQRRLCATPKQLMNNFATDNIPYCLTFTEKGNLLYSTAEMLSTLPPREGSCSMIFGPPERNGEKVMPLRDFALAHTAQEH